MAVKAKKTVDKFKKKKWFSIIAPSVFEGRTVGESPAEKGSLMVGRTVKVSADEITGQRKLRHFAIKLRVKEVKELKAFTEISGFEVNHSYLRRMIRRRISKIVAVVTGTTKDGKRARITAIAISSRKLEKRKEKEIRKILTETISEEIPKKNFEALAQEMIFGITASKIFKKTKSINRIRKLEIIKARVMEGK